MAKTFKDLNKFFDHIEKQVASVLRNEVANLATNTMSETVEEDTYTQYTPDEYERRGRDGGLADPRNYTVELIGDNAISITNDTTGNESYWDSEGYDAGSIDHIIVSGQGYNWSRSRIYKQKIPRDFYAGTVKRLKQGNLLNNVFKAAMRKRGLDVR